MVNLNPLIGVLPFAAPNLLDNSYQTQLVRA